MAELNQLDELEFIVAQAKALNGRLNELGFELSLQPLGGSAGNAVAPRKVAATRRSSYWKIIGKIAQEKGVTKGEAREIYLKEKDNYNLETGRKKGGPKPKKARKTTAGQKRGDKFAKKMSKRQKDYWAEVNKIADKEGVSKSEARKLFKERKAA